MKKFLSIVLALCMVLGCASALAESPASLQGYTSTWDNYGLSKEPITMTIGVGAQDLPDSEENNIALDLIYQATGHPRSVCWFRWGQVCSNDCRRRSAGCVQHGSF